MATVIEEVARAVQPRLWRGIEEDPIYAVNSDLHKSIQVAEAHVRALLSGPVGDVLRELRDAANTLDALDSEHRPTVGYSAVYENARKAEQRAYEAVRTLPTEITDML